MRRCSLKESANIALNECDLPVRHWYASPYNQIGKFGILLLIKIRIFCKIPNSLFHFTKDHVTVCGTLAPRLVEKER